MTSHLHALETLVRHLGMRREALISQWNQSVEADPKMRTHSHLTRREFRDHIPQVLQAFGANLRVFDAHEPEHAQETLETSTQGVAAAAKKHGAHRWQQGYSLEEMAREWGHLSVVVLDEIELFSLQNPHEDVSNWLEARRLWSLTVAEGISASAARFDELGRREAEAKIRDLEALLDKVRSFERERGEILRQASHDMRGSLTVVKGVASLLDPGHLERLKPEDLAQLVQVLNSGVSALSQMMADLLDLARLEAGQEKRVPERFDVGAMLHELGDQMRLLTQEKGLVMRTEGPASLMVETDPIKVSRIVQNLLLNAVKYTDEGHILLAWHELPKEDARHWELIVSDTGYGLEDGPQGPVARELNDTTQEARNIGASIPPGAVSTSPSTSATPTHAATAPHPHTSSIVSGEGIGLSIVKRLCETLDASLELETGPDGSTFRIVFPIAY